MIKIKSTLRAIYDNLWRNPKGRLTSRLKGACDAIPPRRRLTAVSLMLTVFVLTAFFVFGHACYKIGLGKSRQAVEIEHIRSISIPKINNIPNPVNHPAYDDAGMENEN